MSDAAENLGRNIGKLYRESTSVEADVGGLYNEAISVDNNPIQSGSENLLNVAEVPSSGGGEGGDAGSSFPFEIITTPTNTGDLDVTVIGSYVYDYSGSFDEPVLVEIDTLQQEIGATGVHYLYLTLTLDLYAGFNKNVQTAILSIATDDPEASEAEVILKLAEIDVTSSNGQKTAVVEHYTTGAIFYPPIPAYALFSRGDQTGYLQVGLGNDETASATLPSEITGYLLNVKEYLNLKVGENGSEMVNIDTTDIIEGRTISVRDLKNEAGTVTGNFLATQDFVKGVEWAKYNGSSTAAGSLEVGGDNVDSKITNIAVDFSEYSGKMTLTNQSIPSASIELNPIHNEGSGSISVLVGGNPVAGIGDCSLDMGPQTVFSLSSGKIIGMSGSVLQATSTSGGVVYMDASDLPSTATSSEPAKFREVKVCKNGVAKTAYVLMTDPV